MPSYETLLVEQRGAVTLITLNRPQALNALNSQVLADLILAFTAFDADASQGCAVLTGSEKAFAAGADIKEMQAIEPSTMYGADYFSDYRILTDTRKPVIAAVAGFALGGGCELAMLCDFILAADTAKFGQPEIKLGVAPGMGGSQRLARAVGKAKAIKTAATIAAMGPLAVKANKEMVNAAFETGLAMGVQFERRLFHGLFGTEDRKEGMGAFIDKRPPVWTGK